MKVTWFCRHMLGRWWDVYVREDGSITWAEVPDIRP